MKKRAQIMDFVEKSGPCRRADIIKFIVEKIKHRQYNPITDRGYYSCAFWKSMGFHFIRQAAQMSHQYGYLLYPCIGDSRYLQKNAAGLYEVVR